MSIGVFVDYKLHMTYQYGGKNASRYLGYNEACAQFAYFHSSFFFYLFTYNKLNIFTC